LAYIPPFKTPSLSGLQKLKDSAQSFGQWVKMFTVWTTGLGLNLMKDDPHEMSKDDFMFMAITSAATPADPGAKDQQTDLLDCILEVEPNDGTTFDRTASEGHQSAAAQVPREPA